MISHVGNKVAPPLPGGLVRPVHYARPDGLSCTGGPLLLGTMLTDTESEITCKRCKARLTGNT